MTSDKQKKEEEGRKADYNTKEQPPLWETHTGTPGAWRCLLFLDAVEIIYTGVTDKNNTTK